MVEQLVPALIALVSGGFILTSKINTSIKELDRRIDGVELRVAESITGAFYFAFRVYRTPQ